MAKIIAKGMRGRLDIGITGSQIYREVPAIVKRFNLEKPDVDIQLQEMSSAELLNALMHGQLHAGFVNGVTAPSQLAATPLSPDEFVVCLPEDHPLAQKRRVDLKRLASERFVMFSRDVAPANHDNVIAIFSRAGIHPQTAHAARQWLTIVAMVANGLGVSLVPRSLSRSQVRGVRFVPLTGEAMPAPAMLVWNPDFYPVTLDSFLQCAKRTIASEPLRMRSSASVRTGRGCNVK